MADDKSASAVRRCRICGHEVEHGVIEMSTHIEVDHTQEEIVKEVSDSV